MDDFFTTPEEHSIVKANIVEKYFSAWASIMASRFEKVVTIFNDANENCFNNLKENIKSLSDIDKLKFTPNVSNYEVNEEIAEKFENINMIPCFSFIDPFGYAGLSKKLIKALIKDFGCDCLFFSTLTE
ncbi:MAG: three-Cys-motif partner protein TcmP [Caulobacteraceae bacterium]